MTSIHCTYLSCTAIIASADESPVSADAVSGTNLSLTYTKTQQQKPQAIILLSADAASGTSSSTTHSKSQEQRPQAIILLQYDIEAR